MPDPRTTRADDVARRNTPEELLAQVALGNREAFDALYRETSGRLFGICVRVLGVRTEAEEVLQETYMTVWRKAAQYDVARASALSWLGMLARNKAIDRLRAQPFTGMRAPIEIIEGLADPAASPAQEAESLTERERLERCLEALEPRRRGLIRAAFFGGSTYEQLSAQLAAPLGSVKSWIRRGLMQLRECLEA